MHDLHEAQRHGWPVPRSSHSKKLGVMMRAVLWQAFFPDLFLGRLHRVPWLRLALLGVTPEHLACSWPGCSHLEPSPPPLGSLGADSLVSMSSMTFFWKMRSLLMKALTMANADSPFAESSLSTAM